MCFDASSAHGRERQTTSNPRVRSTARRRWLTATWLTLSALIAVPLFGLLYQGFDVLGLPGGLAVLIGVTVVLAIAWVIHLVRTFGEAFLRAGRSLGTSLVQALEANDYIEAAGKRLARPLAYVRRRLDPRSPTGLCLSVSVVLILGLSAAFNSIMWQVLHRGTLAMTDARLANLSDFLHHGEPLHLATFFSQLGGAPVRIPLAIALFALVWVRRPTLRPVIGLALALVVAPLLSDLVRMLVKRPRPAVGATALPGSFSFPSGHAAGAAAAFGYVAYLWVRAARRLRWEIAIALLATLVIVAIGYSRIVLGFHWATDVMAGTVMGLAVAAAAAAVVGPDRGLPLRWPHRSRAFVGVTAVLALALIGWALVTGLRAPLHAPKLEPIRPVALADASVSQATLRHFALHSQTLTGRAMEPVSLIFVGARSQIIAGFQTAGWSVADPADLHDLLRVYSAGLRHRSYPTAPVTPAFLMDRPQDIAFEKAVVAGSVEERHHTRIWFSGYTLANGTPVWLATASLDDRVEIKLTTILPNHHIAPDIDTERDLIAAQLRATGLVGTESTLQAVPPEFGTNAAGDAFFTYGKAIVITLRSPG